jgi:hypothetical protein
MFAYFFLGFGKRVELGFWGPITEELEPILVSKRLGLDEAELESISPIVVLVDSSMTWFYNLNGEKKKKNIINNR